MPVLTLPDHSRPFRLITDASDFATGAILEQPDALNHWHPVAYHSKSLQPAERNYEIHDKGLLAIIHALEIFHHYLEGREDTIEVWSGHRNLVYFSTKQKLTQKQAHWALFLSCFKSSSSINLEPRINQMFCPGVQTIKRGWPWKKSEYSWIPSFWQYKLFTQQQSQC